MRGYSLIPAGRPAHLRVCVEVPALPQSSCFAPTPRLRYIGSKVDGFTSGFEIAKVDGSRISAARSGGPLGPAGNIGPCCRTQARRRSHTVPVGGHKHAKLPFDPVTEVENCLGYADSSTVFIGYGLVEPPHS